MKVSDFIKRFTVNPDVDIKPHFKLITERYNDFDDRTFPCCLNCDELTIVLKSIPRTSVSYCHSCGCLTVVEYNEDGDYIGRCYAEITEEDIRIEREKEYNDFLESIKDKDKLIKLENINQIELGTTLYNYYFGNFEVIYLNKETSDFTIETIDYAATNHDDIMNNNDCDLFDGKWFITKEEL